MSERLPMEKPPAKGDRVRVYTTSFDSGPVAQPTRRAPCVFTATVQDTGFNGVVGVTPDKDPNPEAGLVWVHLKQCRRLKKRVKIQWVTSDWARKEYGRLSAWAPDELLKAVGGPIRITVEVGHG